MRLSRLLLVCLVLGLAPLLSAHAQGQVSPYTVVVPVADTTDAARDNAFGEALAQVLVRTAGGQDLSARTGYPDALKGAAGIVKQYQYQRAATGLSLQVTFDEAAVQRTITQLGVANGGPKPPVLLLVRDEDGSVLTREALAALTQAVAARGYSTVLADPAKTGDTPNLSNADPDQVAALARQYKTGLILLGQLHGNSADWVLVSGGPQQRWTSNGASSKPGKARSRRSITSARSKFSISRRRDSSRRKMPGSLRPSSVASNNSIGPSARRWPRSSRVRPAAWCLNATIPMAGTTPWISLVM